MKNDKNSFQEMDKEQVEAYVEFMNNNKSDKSFLACFLYNTGVVDIKKSQVWHSSKGSIHESLDLFDSEFSLVDSINFSMDGFVPGTLFLYKL